MKLGLRLGREEFNAYQALARQTVLFPKTTCWLLSVSLAGMWLTHESSAQKLVLFCALITFWYGVLLLLMGFVCWLVGWFYLFMFFTSVCSLKCHPRNWYINCFDSFKIKLGILDFTASLTCLLAKQDYGYSQKGVSGPREMLLLCIKGRIFENYPKLQATQLISTGSWNRCYSKIRISPTAFQHLQ